MCTSICAILLGTIQETIWIIRYVKSRQRHNGNKIQGCFVFGFCFLFFFFELKIIIIIELFLMVFVMPLNIWRCMHSTAECVLQLPEVGAYLETALRAEVHSALVLSYGVLLGACLVMWLRHRLSFPYYLRVRKQVTGITESRTRVLPISCGVPRALVWNHCCC